MTPGSLNLARSLLIAAALACAADVGHAADIAFDSAGDSVYNNGWTQGSNGGFGWGGAWVINSVPYRAMIGDSTTNGNGDPEGDGDINSPRVVGGRAWGLLSGTAIRTFSGSLSVGQTFAIDFDDNGLKLLEATSRVNLLSTDGSVAVGVGEIGQNDYYLFTAAGGTTDSGVADTDHGIHLAFTPLSSSIQVSLTPYIAGAVTSTIDVPYSGRAVSVEFSTGSPTGTGIPASIWPYVNNMAITPELSSAATFLLAALALIARRRKLRNPWAAFQTNGEPCCGSVSRLPRARMLNVTADATFFG